MTSFPQPHFQTSAIPDSVEGVTHDSGRSSTLDFLSSGSFQVSGDSGLGDVANSVGLFSYPLSFQNGRQIQANGGSWETFLEKTMTSFSPERRSSMANPYGRDIQNTVAENISSSTPQITSFPADVPAPQSPPQNNFPIFDLNQDIDFSMFLNSPDRPSTVSSSSRSKSNPQKFVERRSISSFRSTNHNDTYSENRDFDRVSKSTGTVDQALDPVTAESSEAELIVSRLLLLKSLVFPLSKTAFQKSEYQETCLSDLFCPHWCEWVSLGIEELLDLYLEESLRSVRKRRTERNQISLSSGCNLNLNERRQWFECSDGAQRLSNSFEATVATKVRSIFYRSCFTPMGRVVFDVRKGPSSPVGEEGIESDYLTTISFMPRATERTPGICVRLFGILGEPTIPPQVRPLNVVPDDSAIIQCVRKNDLRGVQTLFDRGEASARDVDSRGISLLYVSTAHKCEQLMSLLIDLQYAMFTGCSDVFRLLVQGGASTNECDDYGERTTDIITAVWRKFIDAYAGAGDPRALSMEKMKNLRECIAITQLSLDNDCTIHSANHRIIKASPLFSLVRSDWADIDASTLVDAICYLLSIGWDLEEKNSLGQTPLLHAAAACGPQVARCLRALIEKGARLDARDETGQGPLLSALSPPILNWMDMTTNYLEGNYCDNNWNLSEWFQTEDRRHIQDYYDTEIIPDPLGTFSSSRMSRSTLSLVDNESGQLPRDQGSSFTAEQLALAKSDLDSNALSCSEELVPHLQNDDYVYSFNYEGDGVWIRNPYHVLKDRVRIKLKILLEAGCDPNEFNEYGESTNDYARCGLWSQWLWALEKTGYVFDEEFDRWVKRIDST